MAFKEIVSDTSVLQRYTDQREKNFSALFCLWLVIKSFMKLQGFDSGF
jgi:hypothetical protein